MFVKSNFPCPNCYLERHLLHRARVDVLMLATSHACDMCVEIRVCKSPRLEDDKRRSEKSEVGKEESERTKWKC